MPIDPITGLETSANAATAAIKQTTIAVERASLSIKDFDNVLEDLSNVFSKTGQSFKEFENSLNNTGKVSQLQINQLTALSGLVGKLDKQFKETNLGSGGFENQTKLLSGLASKIPIVGQQLSKYVDNMSAAADNGLRLQTTFFQLSAATGNLGNVYASSGDRLQGLNDILHIQSSMIGSSIMSTGLASETVQKYYTQLGKVPGALQATVQGSAGTHDSMTMLTAAIRAAEGTGREFADVVGDMTNAFEKYGLVGQDALKYSTRMTDVANNLGLEFKAIQNHLSAASNEFGRFANAGEAALKMSEGLASVTNNYVQALKATGMTGNQALGVVQQMTSAIGGMSIAQKAFLSGQTGGPGGLMGAFQIEKMMRSGDIEGVLKKARDQMRKQFGSIVTLDEASVSQAAASQLTRQMTILKQGPLGSMVKTDQDAYRMLESFKQMDKGGKPPKELTNDFMAKSIDKGAAIQERTYTEATKIRSLLEQSILMQGVEALGTLQTLGAGSGALSSEMKNDLVDSIRSSVKTGYDKMVRFDTSVKTGAAVSTDRDAIAIALKGMVDTAKNLPKHTVEMLTNLKTHILGNDSKEIANDLKALKAQESVLSKKKKRTALEDEELSNIKIAVGKLGSMSSATTTTSKLGVADYAATSKLGTADYATVGTKLKTSTAAVMKPKLGTSDSAVSSSETPQSDVHVHIDGKCVDCGKELFPNAHVNSISTTTKK